MYAIETWLTRCGKQAAWWAQIRPSEMTGRPFSLFGAEISICHIHLLSLSAPRAPTAALNQSFIRLHISSSLMLQYARAWIAPFHSLRGGSIISVLHLSEKPADPLTETLRSHQNTEITRNVSSVTCAGVLLFLESRFSQLKTKLLTTWC